MKRVPVRLNRGFASNVAGEVCGFGPEVASNLVRRGMAVYVAVPGSEVVTKDAEAVEPLPAPEVSAAPEEPAPEVEAEKRRSKRKRW